MERRITIEEDHIYQEDYQIRMLQANHIEGFLDISGRGIDGKSCYDYDVSGKISMYVLYERNEIKLLDIKKFLSRVLDIIEETEKYLLNIHCILLSPEYIYYEDGEFYFCYYPPGKRSLWEDFHSLTEYFVRRADYKDQECVQMIFLLHKETMEENYSLEKIAAKCLKEAEEEPLKEEEHISTEREKREMVWDAVEEMEAAVPGETENMWGSVKRLLGRRKKPKWGDWDGLYIEEEEL